MNKTQETVNRVFGKDIQVENVGNKIKKMYGLQNEYNPFLKKDGTIFNPFLNHQAILDNPKVNDRVKQYIHDATGLVPNSGYKENLSSPQKTSGNTQKAGSTSFSFNSNADVNSLANMDIATELPKLSSEQIAKIIGTHFSKSKVISPNDAQGIYDAQQNTGMSALAILGIGALESGWGTSNIANKTNNLWGYGAKNSNPLGGAHRYSQMSKGAEQFASEFMKTYYNGYGAKSIYAAGTGNNPSKKGYAYNNDGSISTSWANNIGNIMKTLYGTAKSVGNSNPESAAGFSQNVGKKIANTSTYKNSAAPGQCVWYVRGRANEKLGKDTGAIGNANEMWYNAKKSAKLAPTRENIKPNMIVSYKSGLSSGGAKYGHVIFIEDVVGDTVYYTEGGNAYHQKGTDGVVKTATRQGILNGINTSGGRMGNDVIGFIDLSKY